MPGKALHQTFPAPGRGPGPPNSKGLMLILYYLKLPGSLLQVGDQMDLVICWLKNKVTHN
jgi:hypothetical protein